MFGMFFYFDYRRTLCLSCCLKYFMFLFGGGEAAGGGGGGGHIIAGEYLVTRLFIINMCKKRSTYSKLVSVCYWQTCHRLLRHAAGLFTLLSNGS